MAFSALVLEGFDDDSYLSQFFDAPAGATLVSKTHGRALRASGPFDLGPVGTGATDGVPFSVGMRVEYQGTPGPIVQRYLDSNYNRHWRVVFNSSTEIEVFTASNSTQTEVSRGTFLVPPTSFFLEVLVDSAASGSIQCRVDGASALTFSGRTFMGTPGGAIDRLVTIHPETADVDDLWIGAGSVDPADALGPIRVATLRPSGDGTHTEWSGGDWENVRFDTTPGSSPLTGEPGDKATFTVDALPLPADTVIRTDVVALFGGGGDVDALVRSGSTDANPGLDAPASGWVRFEMDDDPTTTEPWNPATVDSTEFGVEVL